MTMSAFHLAGQHDQSTHGDGAGVSSAVGKLKSGGSIKLAAGETLARSDVVQQRGGGGALLAAVDTDDGARRVRLGVIGDQAGVPKWSAANKGATAELSPAQARSLADGMTDSTRKARQQHAEAEAVIEILEDGGWDPDDRNPTGEQRELLDRHDRLTSGLVGNQQTITTPWGDVVYGTRVTDTGPSIALAVVSDDADADWTLDDAVSDGTALDLTLAQVRALASKLRANAGGGQTAAVDPYVRDRQGRFADKPGGGSGLSGWLDQASDPSGIDDTKLFDLGGKIGEVMRRDGASATDPVAMYDAAQEALAGTGTSPRQYLRALDSRYGTNMAPRVEQALRDAEGDGADSATPAPKVPKPTREAAPGKFVPQSEPDTSVTEFEPTSIESMNDTWHDTEAAWSEQEKTALQTYTSLQYQSINRALREGRGDRGPDAETIANVRSAMRPSPTSQITYRRSGGNAFGRQFSEYASTEELRALVGQTLENDGFTSTTVDESALNDHPAVVHMEIEVPKGTSTAWMHNVGLDHDGELLLDAGSRYEVISVEPMSNFETRMRVRMVP